MTLSSAWMADRYGGKRAFLKYLAARAEGALGKHDGFLNPDLSHVNRLLFVCKGNICRSPFAEQLARVRFGIAAASAGLDAQPGMPADSRALEVARRHGVDLSAHRSRRLRAQDARKHDLVVTFEPQHALHLRDLLGESTAQVALLGLFAGAPYAYLHDPYGLSERYFEACFTRIESGLLGLMARLYDARVRECP